jgi:hypothetical protein
MMKYIEVLMLLITSGPVFSQSTEAVPIRLQFTSDSMWMEAINKKMMVEYSIQNVSDTTLILYGLGDKLSNFPSFQTQALCNQKTTGCSIVLLVFDKDQKRKLGRHRIVSDYSKPLTQERFDSVMYHIQIKFLESTVILQKDESRQLIGEIDLTPFNLSDQAYLQLIYYCGKKVSRYVTDERQLMDQRTYQAKIYQGCVESNKAVLMLLDKK